MSQNPVQTLLVFFKQLFKLVRDLAKDFQGENFTLALYNSLNSQDKRAKFYSGLSLNQAQTKVRGLCLSAVLHLTSVLCRTRMLHKRHLRPFESLLRYFPRAQAVFNSSYTLMQLIIWPR